MCNRTASKSCVRATTLVSRVNRTSGYSDLPRHKESDWTVSVEWECQEIIIGCPRHGNLKEKEDRRWNQLRNINATNVAPTEKKKLARTFFDRHSTAVHEITRERDECWRLRLRMTSSSSEYLRSREDCRSTLCTLFTALDVFGKLLSIDG